MGGKLFRAGGSKSAVGSTTVRKSLNLGILSLCEFNWCNRLHKMVCNIRPFSLITINSSSPTVQGVLGGNPPSQPPRGSDVLNKAEKFVTTRRRLAFFLVKDLAITLIPSGIVIIGIPSGHGFLCGGKTPTPPLGEKKLLVIKEKGLMLQTNYIPFMYTN